MREVIELREDDLFFVECGGQSTEGTNEVEDGEGPAGREDIIAGISRSSRFRVLNALDKLIL